MNILVYLSARAAPGLQVTQPQLTDAVLQPLTVTKQLYSQYLENVIQHMYRYINKHICSCELLCQQSLAYSGQLHIP